MRANLAPEAAPLSDEGREVAVAGWSGYALVAIPAIEGGLYMVPWMIVRGRLDVMASSTTERAILVLRGSLGGGRSRGGSFD